jgi:hypothetical protein
VIGLVYAFEALCKHAAFSSCCPNVRLFGHWSFELGHFLQW